MKRKVSLGRLFIIVFTFFLILPMAVVFLSFLVTIYDSSKDKIAGDLQMLSHAMADKVNASLEGTAMYLVSASEMMAESGEKVNVERLLASGIKNYDLLDNIYILDDEKKITAVSFSSFNKYSNTDFLNIKLNNVKAFENFQPRWSRPFSSVLTSNYIVRLSVRYPGGYVVGDINLEFLTDDLMIMRESEKTSIFIVDSKGDMISAVGFASSLKHENMFAHPAVQQSYQGNHILFDYVNNGAKYTAAGFKIPIVDWYLIQEQEQKDAFSLFYDIVYVTSFAAMLTVFFILTVLFLIKRRLINPIEQLTINSEQLSRGEMPEFSSVQEGGFGELTRLYDSFEHMAQKIEEREQALRDKEEYVRTVFDSTTNTGILVISTKEDPVIIDTNTGAQLILGYKASELIGLPPEALVRYLGEDISKMQKEAQAKGSMVTARFEMTKKNGVNIPVLCTAHPQIKTNAENDLLILVFIDITEITRVQSALEGEKERLDVTLKSIGEGVIATDEDGRVTLVNSSAEKVLGQKYRFMIGQKIQDILQIYDFDTGEDLSGSLSAEADITRKTFRANIISETEGLITVTLTASAMLSTKGEAVGFVYVFRDITERIKIDKELMNRKKQLEEINRNLEIRVTEEAEKRRKNEQMLFEQAKFAAMGQMISAIAHQWRQPLNALALYTQDIEDAYHMKEVDEHYLKRFVGNSMSLINHMSGTIDDFRNFFHSSNIREEVNIVHVVVKSMELVNTQLRNQNINYELTIKNQDTEDVFVNSMPDGNSVYGRDIFIYPSEMKQVLLNIIHNARDAITEKRSRSKSKEGNIYLYIEFKADKVVMSISNDGGQIPEDSLARIFDPYYTTKPEGEGTGIGLYMSKIMIEDHIGGLMMAENVDKGAKFTITIYYDKQ